MDLFTLLVSPQIASCDTIIMKSVFLCQTYVALFVCVNYLTYLVYER